MQIGQVSEKDDDASVNVAYAADPCSRDWGPFRDIIGNVDIVISMVDEYGLSEEEREGSPIIAPEWD